MLLCLNQIMIQTWFTTQLYNKLHQCAPMPEQGEIANYFSWDRHGTLDEFSASVHLDLKTYASVRQLVKMSSKKTLKSEKNKIGRNT